MVLSIKGAEINKLKILIEVQVSSMILSAGNPGMKKRTTKYRSHCTQTTISLNEVAMIERSRAPDR